MDTATKTSAILRAGQSIVLVAFVAVFYAYTYCSLVINSLKKKKKPRPTALSLNVHH